MNVQIPALSVGSILALLVLVLSVVFIAIGRLDPLTGGVIAVLALARLT